ncbi:hypothetical protein [Amphiplicatus metriothermophilus]|uniref:Uncharacterized protein n=1 Tax=Amphiplicatus metriothermophilus TaxID=1519374 RepID=A0A239PJN8_9PROT|nr:hypothetical protein [Amphiplicatus metriothermophilus]MBB5517645.1 hypothetical protein [Amphiplicatus metriothermophilus]SNT68021.1 hypothetical protein SAMN06297382_0517 [Amphiplicatus metriothermophilus]
MDAPLERLKEAADRLSAVREHEKIAAWDGRLGRMIAAAKAVGWCFVAALGGAAAWAVYGAASGWIAAAAAAVGAAIIAYALLRAWRALAAPARASDLLIEELQTRASRLGGVLSAARLLRGGRGRADR